MEKELRNKWLIAALVIIVSFYLALLIGSSILRFLADPELIIPFIVICCGLLIGFTLYTGYKNRQIAYFPITFSIVGIVLILLGSVILVPYTIRQTYRKDISRNQTVYFSGYDSSERPVYENGSPREITIPAFGEKKYFWASRWLMENISIIQIDISTSGPLAFKLAVLSLDGAIRDILFNRTMHSGWFESDRSGSWITYFWTPPFSTVNIGFLFENPSNRSIVFSFKVTECFLKTTEDKWLTRYHTLIDSYFAYMGISLICTAVMLNAYLYKSRRNNNISQKGQK